jgi:cellulose synthase (UDP-forming)
VTPERRATGRLALLRLLIASNLLLGASYLAWRYTHTINWAAWALALALLAAETYTYLDAWLFGLTVWRLRRRGQPPPAPSGATVDLFITCYDEPVGLVRDTVRAALAVGYPHRTYVLDDGDSPAMRAMAEAAGAGYLVRAAEWRGRPRHAKAGNLNNALLQTTGEFLLILDADQIPDPRILDRTLGYFGDPRVAFVQTPQWFYNVPPGDPFGCQAPLFYGPIMQGKDGWNAAFFCGSNAVLRREALMQLGLTRYTVELELRVRRALRAADRLLRRAAGGLGPAHGGRARAALVSLRRAVRDGREALRRGEPIQEVTWAFQERARAVSRMLVADDLARIRAELADVPGIDPAHLEASLAETLDDEAALETLAGREASPLAALEAVRGLLVAVDVDRGDEAQPVMPLATISVTEDMATAMRLHALGWRSVYHHEVLARGLAPEDLRTALQQRLRWAQGTIQVFLRENPLLVPGLTVGQRLMYLGTMGSYFSGFFSPVFLLAPVLYLFFGLLPVRAYSAEFFQHLLPYLFVNQLLFVGVGWGVPTWRGQQYHLALFPLWIKAVTSAIGNVSLGRRLAFVVTPKTRPGGGRSQYALVRPQLAVMALLATASVYALAGLALGLRHDVLPVGVNLFWAGYDLLALSVVLTAARYRAIGAPDEAGEAAEAGEAGAPAGGLTAADVHRPSGVGAR